jgi:hypothetical protein
VVIIKHVDEPSAPAVVDVGLLWLLEMAIPSGATNWMTEDYDGDGLRDQIHAGLLFCDDNEEPEATLLLTERHCKLIAMSIGPNASVPGDPHAGRRLLMAAFRAERTLRDGPEAPAATDRAPTKARTIEWLKEFTPDPINTD